MTKTAKKLKAMLLELSDQDRKALARFLFEAMPDGEPELGPEDGEAWAREIDRRAEELRNDPSAGIPWELVHSRLRKLLS